MVPRDPGQDLRQVLRQALPQALALALRGALAQARNNVWLPWRYHICPCQEKILLFGSPVFF